MAIVDFGRLIDFKTWFTRTNELGTALGDTDNLNLALGANLSNAANTVASNLGDVTTIDPTIRPGSESLVESMNNLKGEIDTFRISEAEPQAYDMHPIAVFGDDSDLDAHGFVE